MFPCNKKESVGMYNKWIGEQYRITSLANDDIFLIHVSRAEKAQIIIIFMHASRSVTAC